MTVREYIGARYVPLFMGDWDNTNTYEPLSVVQYQGNSYTSRQAVPAGIDIANELYWIETGNYNAQIEAYRQEVLLFDGRISANTEDISDEVEARGNADTALQNAIDTINSNYWVTESRLAQDSVTNSKIAANSISVSKIQDTAVSLAKLESSIQNILKHHHAVIIGDSYSAILNPETYPNYPTREQLWWYMLCQQMNLTPHCYALSGRGFVHAATTTSNFAAQIQQAIDDTSFSNADVDYVFIFGGLNDVPEVSGGNVYNAAMSCCNLARQHFTGAKIILAGCNTAQTINSTNVRTIEHNLQSAAAMTGCAYVDTTHCLFGTTLVSENINWHPNTNGQKALCALFMSAICGCGAVYLNRDIAGTYNNGSGNLKFSIQNNYLSAFGLARTDGNGVVNISYPYGVGYLIYQPITGFAGTAHPLQLNWDYPNGVLSGTGTANTTYTISQVLTVF